MSVFATHDDLVCVRHQRWLGCGPLKCIASEQFALTACPGLFVAHRLHQTLIRRWGRQVVRARFYDAVDALSRWRQWNIVTSDPGVAHRRAALSIDDNEPPYTPKDFASWYPNIVALTELFVWQDDAIKRTGLRDRNVLENGLQYVSHHVVQGLRPSGVWDPYLCARRTPPAVMPNEVEVLAPD